MNNIFELPIFRNSLVDWTIAVGVAISVVIILMTMRRWVKAQHERNRSAGTGLFGTVLQVLSRTTLLLLIAVGIFVGAQLLTTGPATQRILGSVITIGLFWQAGIWLVTATEIWLEHKRSRSLGADRAVIGSLGVIGFVVNVAIWAIVLLLTLDNLGVDITALIAGLGIGGIAVALAVQNVLGDLFASLSITLDRPFVIGDFLIVGDFMGSVEYIGIKSTRLRSLSGEQIIISNSDLLGSRVRNYGRMNERRVVFGTSVTYETRLEHLECIPALVRTIIEAQAGTRFDRCHFAKHAAASLDFETVYYVLSADYNRYMDIQQAINLRLHRELSELGVEFAYPTQKVYLVTQAAPRERSDHAGGGTQRTGRPASQLEIVRNQ
jgi:small-conductance mechanosensitive channel